MMINEGSRLSIKRMILLYGMYMEKYTLQVHGKVFVKATRCNSGAGDAWQDKKTTHQKRGTHINQQHLRSDGGLKNVEYDLPLVGEATLEFLVFCFVGAPSSERLGVEVGEGREEFIEFEFGLVVFSSTSLDLRKARPPLGTSTNFGAESKVSS